MRCEGIITTNHFTCPCDRMAELTNLGDRKEALIEASTEAQSQRLDTLKYTALAVAYVAVIFAVSAVVISSFAEIFVWEVLPLIASSTTLASLLENFLTFGGAAAVTYTYAREFWSEMTAHAKECQEYSDHLYQQVELLQPQD